MSLASWFEIMEGVDPTPLTKCEIIHFLSENKFPYNHSVLQLFILTGGLEGHLKGTLFHFWGLQNYFKNMKEWWGNTKTNHLYLGDACISAHLVSIGPVGSTLGLYFECTESHAITNSVDEGIRMIENRNADLFY